MVLVCMQARSNKKRGAMSNGYTSDPSSGSGAGKNANVLSSGRAHSYDDGAPLGSAPAAAAGTYGHTGYWNAPGSGARNGANGTHGNGTAPAAAAVPYGHNGDGNAPGYSAHTGANGAYGNGTNGVHGRYGAPAHV
jgi:hypothetical protein